MAGRRKARRPVSRRERRRRSSKVFTRIAIGIGLAVPLLYFAFTQIFFDPFEGSQPPFPVLVPRDVDVFVHRLDLESDIGSFPRPVLFDRLSRTGAWKDLAATGRFEALEWPERVEAAAAAAAEAAQASPLDPLRDLLGREVAVVGRLPPAGAGEPQYALLARISGRAKLAVEMLGFSWGLERALPGATVTAVSDAEAGLAWRRLEHPEAGTWFFARRQDLLVLGRDEPLVRDVLAAVAAPREASLGLSRLYIESLPPPKGAPDERFSVDFLLDAGRFLQRLEPGAVDEGPPRHALADLLSRLVDPSLLREAVGRLDLDERLSLRLAAEVDSVRAREGHTGLLGAPAFVAAERLSSVAGMLPADTSLVVTVNVELRALLQSVLASLHPDVVALMNDRIRDVRRYNQGWPVDNVNDLAGQLDRIFSGEVTIALRPLDHAVPEGSQPLPLLAIVLRVRDVSLWTRLDEAVVRGYKALGLDNQRMWQQNEGVGVRKWLGMPAGLPVEEMSYIVLDGTTAVIATDDDFVREIVACYTRSRSTLAATPAVRDMLGRLGKARGNLAAWTRSAELLRLVEPYAEHLQEDETRVDYAPLRVTKLRELVARLHPSFQGREDSLPEADRKALDAQLDELILGMERERREVLVPRLAAAWREGLKWMGLVGDAAMALHLGEREAQLAVEATTALVPR